MIYANNALNYLLFLPLYLMQTVHSVCAICHLHPDKIQKVYHSHRMIPCLQAVGMHSMDEFIIVKKAFPRNGKRLCLHIRSDTLIYKSA